MEHVTYRYMILAVQMYKISFAACQGYMGLELLILIWHSLFRGVLHLYRLCVHLYRLCSVCVQPIWCICSGYVVHLSRLCGAFVHDILWICRDFVVYLYGLCGARLRFIEFCPNKGIHTEDFYLN